MPHPINIIYPQDYPFLLQQISRPPKQLHIQGTLPPSNYIYLCVIGSRTPSSYGKEVCTHLIKGLIGYPIVIVSGMAVGIDSFAHEAALAAQLPTIAFPGSGLSKEVLYPYSGRGLAERIVKNGGALLSSFEINQMYTRWTFPERNRLMAGISKATLIIEGKHGSGTLSTAEYASQFNRDVMIVPGSIFSELSYGPLLLLKDGAHPVTNSQEILQILGFESKPESDGDIQPTLMSLVECSPLEKKILDHLSSPTSRDDCIRSLGISLSQANAALSELEIKGAIIEEGNTLRRVYMR